MSVNLLFCLFIFVSGHRFHYQHFLDKTYLYLHGTKTSKEGNLELGQNNEIGAVWFQKEINLIKGLQTTFDVLFTDFGTEASFAFVAFQKEYELKHASILTAGATDLKNSLAIVFDLIPAHVIESENIHVETELQARLVENINGVIREVGFWRTTIPNPVPLKPRFSFLVTISRDHVFMKIPERKRMPGLYLEHFFNLSTLRYFGFTGLSRVRNNIVKSEIHPVSIANWDFIYNVDVENGRAVIPNSITCVDDFVGPACIVNQASSAKECNAYYDCKSCLNSKRHCNWCNELQRCLSVAMEGHSCKSSLSSNCDESISNIVSRIFLWMFLLLLLIVSAIFRNTIGSNNIFNSLFSCTLGIQLSIFIAFLVISSVTYVAEDYTFAILCAFVLLIYGSIFAGNVVLFKSAQGKVACGFLYGLILALWFLSVSLSLFLIPSDWSHLYSGVSKTILFEIISISLCFFFVTSFFVILKFLPVTFKNSLWLNHDPIKLIEKSDFMFWLIVIFVSFFGWYVGFVFSRVEIPAASQNHGIHRWIIFELTAQNMFCYPVAASIGFFWAVLSEVYVYLLPANSKAQKYETEMHSFNILGLWEPRKNEI